MAILGSTENVYVLNAFQAYSYIYSYLKKITINFSEFKLKKEIYLAVLYCLFPNLDQLLEMKLCNYEIIF